MVTYFAGIFYIGRLFVYHQESLEKQTAEKNSKHIHMAKQYALMEERLWKIITLPSFVLLLTTGVSLLLITGAYLELWFHLKAFFLVLLIIYHLSCRKIKINLTKGNNPFLFWFLKPKRVDARVANKTSKKLRYFNEIPTVLLLLIVFLAVGKSLSFFGIAFGLTIFLGVLLFLGVKKNKIVNRN